MTYRYVELALYHRFKCSDLKAYTKHHEPIENLTPFQELVLWSRKVLSYEIIDDTIHITLDFEFEEFDRY